MTTKRLAILLGLAGICVGRPVLGSTITNNNAVSPALVVHVTVQKAVGLILAADTGCTAGSDYTINLGRVDAYDFVFSQATDSFMVLDNAPKVIRELNRARVSSCSQSNTV